MKQDIHTAPEANVQVASNRRRTVVYSQETTAAYGNVIDIGMTGNAEDVLSALRHLAMMVHCDFTGELRQPHTHLATGLNNASGTRR